MFYKEKKVQSAKGLILLDHRTTNTGVVYVVALGARVRRGDLTLLTSAVTARLPLACVTERNTGSRYGTLEEIGRLDDSSSHTANKMEIDVAMEEPHTRVISLKADDCVAESRYDETIALEGYAGKRAFIAVPDTEARGDDLEDVAVEMHGVRVHVRVVHDNLDGFAGLDDPGVDTGAVGCGVHATGRQSSVEGRNLRRNPWLSVERCAGTDALEVSLVGGELNVVIDGAHKSLTIKRLHGEVVEDGLWWRRPLVVEDTVNFIGDAVDDVI